MLRQMMPLGLSWGNCRLGLSHLVKGRNLRWCKVQFPVVQANFACRGSAFLEKDAGRSDASKAYDSIALSFLRGYSRSLLELDERFFEPWQGFHLGPIEPFAMSSRCEKMSVCQQTSACDYVMTRTDGAIMNLGTSFSLDDLPAVTFFAASASLSCSFLK